MTEFLAFLLRANLAMAVIIAAILIARLPMRRLFGAWGAYALWIVLPIATWAALSMSPLSRSAPAGDQAVVPMAPMFDVVDAAQTVILQPPLDASQPFPWIFVLWAAGTVAGLAWVAWSQLKFAREVRGGRAGPAVAGVLLPRIVTPADFEDRFTEQERALILAHERRHLQRQDARINGLVTLLQCLCWFNPLVHVAAYVLRLDQEMSCDAAVMTRHPSSGRAYAEAMLKTQGAGEPLPLGCYWPTRSRHPLEKRIQLLKRGTPGPAWRLVGACVAVGLALGSAVAARAVQPDDLAPGADQPFMGVTTTLGRADAPVTLIEYGSPVCIACTSATTKVLPEIKAKYIDTGQVRYEYRDIATEPESLAVQAMLTARCGGKNDFFAITSDIHARLFDILGAPQPLSVLRDIARDHNIGDKAFDRCVLDPQNQARMLEIAKNNLIVGRIQGAPTYAFYAKDHPDLAMHYYGSRSAADVGALITSARRGEVANAPGLQTSAYEAQGSQGLPQDQLTALRANLKSLALEAPSPNATAPSVNLHGTLTSHGKRREFGIDHAASPDVVLVPISQNAAMAFSVVEFEGSLFINALVKEGDDPVARSGMLRVSLNKTETILLPNGGTLALTLRPRT